MKNKKKRNPFRVVCIVLAAVLAFRLVDFGLSEWTDTLAYKDAVRDDIKWEETIEKAFKNEVLSADDYEFVLSQTGLGKDAFNKLVDRGRMDKIEDYRDFFLSCGKGYEYLLSGYSCRCIFKDDR